MDHKVRRPVAGSERTILALVRVRDGEILPAETTRPQTMEMAKKEIDAEAARTADDVLASIKEIFVRDKKGVIQYAVLQSENPLTASTVLAPGFADRFAKTVGPDLIVAMPNRFQVLVFSRQDQAFRMMAETIISGYLSSNYPVSREIFALERGRLRSLGVLE